MIAGIFFAEFDNEAGPKIVFQHPPGVISEESFEQVREYVITKPQLCGRTVCVRMSDGLFAMGCPSCIEHPKYHRNALIFNVGFVFSPASAEMMEACKPILRKIARVVSETEQESELLFNGTSRERFIASLPKIRSDLNSRGMSIIPLDDANSLFLKIMPARHLLDSESSVAGLSTKTSSAATSVNQLPTTLVPIPIMEEVPQQMQREWDLAVQEVIPLIDGVRNVTEIARIAHMQAMTAANALKRLKSCQAIAFIPPVFPSTTYTLSREFHTFADNADMTCACLEAVCVEDGTAATSSDVIQIYSLLQPGYSFETFAAEPLLKKMGIHPYRAIVFGLVNGFLHVHFQGEK